MKRAILLFLCLALLLTLPAAAAEGRVSYLGGAEGYIFDPGSEHSPSDLFPEFKDVMPGDVISQKIIVKNDAAEGVKANIYLRALGAHADSAEFLSKLWLRVKKSGEAAYMFDAAADDRAQLADWVLLGTLYSGGEVELEVELTVPVELDNRFASAVGYLDWEFKVEEFPAEPEDPTPPDTGDNGLIFLWIFLAILSAGLTVLFAKLRRRQK